MGQHIHQAAYQPGVEIAGRRTCGQDAPDIHEQHLCGFGGLHIHHHGLPLKTRICLCKNLALSDVLNDFPVPPHIILHNIDRPLHHNPQTSRDIPCPVEIGVLFKLFFLSRKALQHGLYLLLLDSLEQRGT